MNLGWHEKSQKSLKMQTMKNKFLLFITFCLLINSPAIAQPITGLWEVTKVTAGDQEMTPVAKWTRIHGDGTYESGNGWLQNAVGQWSYDPTTNGFRPVEDNGIIDPYGPFTVRFQEEDEAMIWQRQEDGMEVTVFLHKIDKLPMSPADKLRGLWDLKQATEEGTDITSTFDPEDKYYLFIRWDRIYLERTPLGERATGYWHINAHRPEITFMSHTTDKQPEMWRVLVEDNELQLTGLSDSNNKRVLTFSRINEFPE